MGEERERVGDYTFKSLLSSAEETIKHLCNLMETRAFELLPSPNSLGTMSGETT